MNKLFSFIKNNKKATIVFVSFITILAILPLLPTQLIGGYTIHVMVIIILYAYWASAWNLLGGFAGQFSLGTSAYIGIGAYTASILYIFDGLSPWIGMFIAGIIAGILSLIIGYPCFRLKGSYYTLSTVALLFVLRIIFANESIILGYQTDAALGKKIPWTGENFWGMQFTSKSSYFYIILVMFVVCFLICVFIKNSKTGYYLAAIRTNQNAASSLGVNVMEYKLRIGFISAFLIAMGGAFYSFFLSVIDPYTFFGYDLSIRIMLLAVIGGSGTLIGPVIGAFILTSLNEILRTQLGSKMSGISFVIYGFITIIIVLFLPKGFVGLKDVFLRIMGLSGGNKKRVVTDE